MPFRLDDKNYANDTEVASNAKEFLSKVSDDVRSKRETLNQKMLEYYNIYRTVFDVKFYNGSIEVYDPQLRKNVEFYVSRLKKALFPTDDVFEVEPVTPDSEDNAKPIAAHMKWQIEKRIKLKAKMSRFLRQLVMYGWSPVKCIWEQESKKLVGMSVVEKVVKQYVWDEALGKKILVPTGEVRKELIEEEKTIYTKNNPTFEPVDVFNFYVYPATANGIDDVYGTVEIITKPLIYLKERSLPGPNGEAPIYSNVDEVTADSGEGTWEWTREARLAVDGHQQPLENNQIEYVTWAEYWGWVNFGTAENAEMEQGVISVTTKGVVIQVRKNSHYDKCVPYRVARMTELENEFYSDGLLAPLASLQYYINDTLAQTFDGLTYTLNPIVKYDPGRVVNVNTIAFAPGAMWALTDPSAVVLESPSDVSQAGFNAVAQAKQIIEGYPGVANIPMTGRKAATHITAIQQEYSLPIMDLAENIEEQVMSPWLGMVYIRNQQFLSENEVFLVTGKQGVKYWQTLSPEMLVGDYEFYWRGSNQATNIHVKARQMMEFVNMTAPFAELIQRQGSEIDYPYIFKKIWTDGLALDGEDKIVKSIEFERSIDPETENLLLSVGKYIPVSNNDNHEQHIQSHNRVIETGDEYARKAAVRHNEEHEMKMQKAAMQASAPQSQQPETEEEASEGLQPPPPN